MAKDGRQILEGVICYLPPLVLILLFVQKRTKFVTAHMKQGLMLLILAVVAGVLKGSFFLAPLGFVLDFFILLCMIMGIVKVVQKKKWEIPVMGKYAAEWDF